VTVTIASPHKPELAVEVARTLTLGAVELAPTVRTPLELTLVVPKPVCPDGIDQVTLCEGLLAPATVAVKVCVPPLATETDAGLTVIEGTDPVTETVADPSQLPTVEVAHTVKLVTVETPATTTPPLELMVTPGGTPPLPDGFTVTRQVTF